ncbi:hypothetical protein P3T25_007230 [Paraburkholderia sp. GAS32]
MQQVVDASEVFKTSCTAYGIFQLDSSVGRIDAIRQSLV